jgi:serine phosphatase RsbU (regulator of sigma subunit)/ligand-binding sensor domain-containing protein
MYGFYTYAHQKNIMKRFTAITIQFLIVFEVSAQINKYGVPIFRNFRTEVTQGAEYNWCVLKDKLGVIYFGNDNKGIIRYDGYTWSVIHVGDNSAIRTLGIDNKGVIYVGATSEFGYLEPAKDGEMTYVSLSRRFDRTRVSALYGSDSVNKVNGLTEKINIGEITSLAATDTAIYFLGKESLFIYDTRKDTIDYINLREQNFEHMLRITLVKNRIFLTDNVYGLLELKGKKVEILANGDFFKMKRCLILIPCEEDELLVGTYQNGISLYNYEKGTITRDFPDPSINEKLKSALIYTGIGFPSGEIIIGTLNEGIFIFSKEGTLISRWSRETTDLPDNSITALYSDNGLNSELWISSAGFLSKAYINIPITEFSIKSGLDGVVNNICEFNNNIYVATDVGLFKSVINMDGIKKFEELNLINKQVFRLYNASFGRENFLLVGTNLGLYKITTEEKVICIDDMLAYNKNKKKLGKLEFCVRSITQSKFNPGRFYIGLNTNGMVILEYDGINWKLKIQIKSLQGYVDRIIESESGDLYIHTWNPNFLYRLPGNDSIPRIYNTSEWLGDGIINNISAVGGEIVISTSEGLFRHYRENDSWIPFNEVGNGYYNGINCNDIFIDPDGDLWLELIKSRIYVLEFTRHNNDTLLSSWGALNLLPNIEKLDIRFMDKRIWIAKSKSVYIIDKAGLTKENISITPLFSKIITGSDSVIMNQNFYTNLENGKKVPSSGFQGTEIPEITFNNNQLSFFWSTPYYIEEDAINYSYKLDGLNKEWSKWGKIQYKDFTNLPNGHYVFRVKAKTITELKTNEAVYEFIILKPWYKTIAAIIFYFIAFILLIYGVFKAYTFRLRNENIRLENLVAKRTSEVNAQKKIIEEKNRKITESINYSKHIQDSILIKQDEIDKIIPDSFVYLKPRDIVSGDFYWFARKEDYSVIAAVDCTGHGVPGAFMCMIGSTLLNFIVREKGIVKPSEILNNLNSEVIKVLQQEREDTLSQDGMDMSVCTIDTNNGTIQYAGAKNPLYIVINNDLIILEADPFSIGGTHLSRNNTRHVEFKNQEFKLISGSSVYLFTDGYIDQFGGPDNKSYNIIRFGELLKSISKLKLAEQYRMIDITINEWMNTARQIDDMLVIGIKL